MGNTYAQNRIDRLLDTQNLDGGWGYTPGKQSWLEPTAYALLALHSSRTAEVAREKAWKLVESWQRSDGAWRPCAQVDDAHWTTALMVTLHCIRGQFDGKFRSGVEWLLSTSGAEGSLKLRFGHWLKPDAADEDFTLVGWPWRPGTVSWVEPTAHAVIALRKAASVYSPGNLRSRVAVAQKMLLDRRCVDGGWNYGNRRVLNADLNSYPETTALGLLGLQNAQADVSASVKRAKQYLETGASDMAQAWLSIALRNFGQPVPDADCSRTLPVDTQVLALQALSVPKGGHELLQSA